MKRILVYNQSQDVLLSFENVTSADFQIETAMSIHEVFKKYLFHNQLDSMDRVPDVFLANLCEPTKEVIDFLNYVNRYRPKLKMIVVMASSRKVSLLKTIFKGKDICISEPDCLPDILN